MLHLELYAETPHETGEPAVPVLRLAQLLGVDRTWDDAGGRAVAHANAENMGDGDYVVKNSEGRRVARIEVRAGELRVIRLPPGPTPAEELESLYEECPLCRNRMVLIPCGACGVRRCVCCLADRRCCNPTGGSSV